MSSAKETNDLVKTLIAEVTKMTIAFNQFKEEYEQSQANAETMYKNLNVKFDVFNLESRSRQTVQQTDKQPSKLSRPAFFKKIFAEERDKYMDKLYTQEEIDAAMADKEVRAKKKDSDKILKACMIIYTNHIKADNPVGRWSAFQSFYDQSNQSSESA